ncbi:Carbon monoxide dehydrogenase small chain [Variovorax sp. SRS16]|uniref:(2Fe-2S)-binding protein n=1 Tax=Variovorax sp. SRS16 TaxID=282217 RepID=UPI00131882E6|nr:(2Fe-2S)-binding protein [Variovorax sp. SRS16]VTU14987.1 Carbon monoxide dehydrogenase small chain [Variovorax sp. SRS16]
MPHDLIQVRLRVNGEWVERSVEPRLLLADFLRHELGLTGTHIGCEHGVCGACTVQIDGEAARSCLHFVATVDGAAVTTVEGLAGESLHPLQAAFHKHNGLQCGYCTPGFLMTAEDYLRRNPHPTEEEARNAMANNLCRCTGYEGIVKAVLEASIDISRLKG